MRKDNDVICHKHCFLFGGVIIYQDDFRINSINFHTDVLSF